MTRLFVDFRKQSAVRLAVLLLTISSPGLLFATAQQGDNLVLNGEKYVIYTNPLEPYLEKHPDAIPKPEVVSTGLWRGYVATWEVKEGRLFLTDIGMLRSVTKPGQSGFSTELRSVLSQVFPGQNAISAEWFTGHIIVPDGKRVNYVHMGYASTYEKYILLRVEQGTVIRNWTADTAGFVKFRDAQFAAFEQTEEYRNALAEAKKEGETGGSMSDEQIEEFLREYYSGRYMSMIFNRAQSPEAVVPKQ